MESKKPIEARGAIAFYLPSYSPDLNPIEQLFAKLKALLRKVAAYSLKNGALSVRSLCKTAPPVSIKSPELNARRTSQIQDMVNLDGGRFNLVDSHDEGSLFVVVRPVTVIHHCGGPLAIISL